MSVCFIQNITLDEDNTFKLITNFSKLSFDLTILENLNAWKIHVNKSALALSAEAHHIVVEEHYEKLKCYFQQSPDDVEFKFDDGKFTLNLLLKDDLKVVYFKTILEKANFFKCVSDWIDQLYCEKNNNFESLYKEQKKCLHLESIASSYESKLSELTDRKQKEETNLYNKFLAILNEKKLQIQHLNDLLIAFRRGRPTTNKTNPKAKMRVKKCEKKNIKKKQASPSNSESDSFSDGYNTDENSNSKITLNESHQRLISPKPSTSKQNFDFLIEDEPDIVLPKRMRLKSAKVMIQSKESEKIIKADTKLNNNKDELTVNFSTQDLLNGL
ncbi:DNA repair protein XRCC4-like [Cylas formicarius]|uniref:DNA repair protein XRCC4-like n=1 Tax=Cylas formicarius TaxID=197179 RepID=UPI0029584419|nr:DNA repair protein XRCC4-like [Cylas formicarius]